MTMRLAWLTDIHLNFVTDDDIDQLCRENAQTFCDAVLIGGDIGEADSVFGYLLRLARKVGCPIYFVLGNHDYYGGWVADVREGAANLKRLDERLRWLPAEGVVQLTESTALVRHGCWADGRCGDFMGSTFEIADHDLIEDFRGLDKKALFEKVRSFGDEAAIYVRKALTNALNVASEVVLLTHVPPFGEACERSGRASDENSLPHYICQAVGDVIVEIMQKHPRANLTILCGHTHGGGRYEPLPNVKVISGEARYFAPRVQKTIEVG